MLACADSQDYASLGVSRPLQGGLDGLGRAVDAESEHLMQFALIPSTEEAPAVEVIRAIGHRLNETWKHTNGSSSSPLVMREVSWAIGRFVKS